MGVRCGMEESIGLREGGLDKTSNWQQLTGLMLISLNGFGYWPRDQKIE